MKCKTSKKLIYLFSELTENEHQEVRQHISTCTACHKLYHNVAEQPNLLKQAFSTPAIDSQEEFTDRIMTAVIREQTVKTSRVDRVLYFLQYNPIRYAMAAVSFFLVAFFLSESTQMNNVSQPLAEHNILPQPRTSAFNLVSEEFIERVRSADTLNAATILFSVKPSKKLNLYECIRICRSNQEPDKCETCKSIYAKFKLYENI